MYNFGEPIFSDWGHRYNTVEFSDYSGRDPGVITTTKYIDETRTEVISTSIQENIIRDGAGNMRSYDSTSTIDYPYSDSYYINGELTIDEFIETTYSHV